MTLKKHADEANTLRISPTALSAVVILLLSGFTLVGADSSTEDILKMIAVKVPDETILLQVRKAGKPISLSADDLIRLKKAGASDQLVRALLQGDATQSAPPARIDPVSQSAADLKSADDPEILGVPYFIDPISGKFLELERQSVNAGVKLKAMGFAGGRSVIRFEGRRSSVRFQNGSPIRFILRTGGSAIADPSSVVNMDRLTSAKDHREATTGKVNPMGMGAKSTMGATDVPVKATQCGRSSLCFTASTPLVAGEYVVTLRESKYGFLFGVD
jgi:hypothetical protein